MSSLRDNGKDIDFCRYKLYIISKIVSKIQQHNDKYDLSKLLSLSIPIKTGFNLERPLMQNEQ